MDLHIKTGSKSQIYLETLEKLLFNCKGFFIYGMTKWLESTMKIS